VRSGDGATLFRSTLAGRNPRDLAADPICVRAAAAFGPAAAIANVGKIGSSCPPKRTFADDWQVGRVGRKPTFGYFVFGLSYKF
jgi:hypothetical protein